MPGGHEAAFVGRARELEVLADAWAETRAGRGRVVAIVGDAGIGKTRTIEEFAVRADIGPEAILWGRCPEQLGAPAYWPWVRIIRALAATRDDAALRADLGPDAALIAQLVPDLRPRLPDVAEAPRSDGSDMRFLLCESVAGLFQRASRRIPLVVVLDDLHWADEASLALLAFVARELRGAHLLVIGTLRRARDLRRTPHGLAELVRVAQVVALAGLDRAAVERLVEAAADAPPDPALLARLYDTSEGNPFFLAALVRGLRQPMTAGPGLPEDVRASIRRQLEPLSPDEQTLLTLAAVIGRGFELRLLQAASAASAEAVLGAVTTAVAASLVVEDEAAGRFRFAHALIRETLYADLLPAARAAAHGRVARALEAVHAATMDAPLAELAVHFFHAAPLGEGGRALDYALRAAAEAGARLAYDEAVGHYERALRALSLTASDELRRLDVLLALGEAARRSGDVVKARTTYQRAATVARALGDATRFTRAALGSYRAAGRYGVHPPVVALLDEALSMLGDDATALRAGVLAALAVELHFARVDGRCEAVSLAAVAAARAVGTTPVLLPALMARHLTLLGAADLPARLAVSAEVRSLTAAPDADPRHVLPAALCQVIDLLERGEIRTAETEIGRYAERAEQSRLPHLRWHAKVLVGHVALLRGRFDEAERLAADALASRRDGQDLAVAAVFFLQTFERRRETGHLADLEARTLSFEQSEPQARPWRCMRALLQVELGQMEAARAGFEELAGHDFEDLPLDAHYPAVLATLAELAAALGDGVRAAQLYQRLLPYEGRNVVVHTYTVASHGAVTRFLGLLAAAAGRPTEGERHFTAALAMNERMGARVALAHTQYDLARFLSARAAAGDAGPASELLAEAWRTAEALGMQVLLDRMTALRATATPAAARSSVAPVRAVLRREGDSWRVSYGTELQHLEHTKGVSHLHTLLQHPGREFHVLDLASPEGALKSRAGDAGELLDPAARAAYKRRLQDLRDELEEARRFNDPERAAHAESEIGFLTDELARAVGLGARNRKAASHAERARINLTRTIGAVLKKIAGECPRLGQLLAASVRTGLYCSYSPDPRLPITWELE